MRAVKLFQTGLVIAISALFFGEALAENCSGRWTNVLQTAEKIDLDHGHTLTVLTWKGSSTSDNWPPFAATVGMCGAWVLTTPDGKFQVGYACLRKNKDGDSFSDAGGMAPGADRGTWKQTGGTGVYAGKNGSGWYQTLADDGKVSTGTWAGNCE